MGERYGCSPGYLMSIIAGKRSSCEVVASWLVKAQLTRHWSWAMTFCREDTQWKDPHSHSLTLLTFINLILVYSCPL